MKTSPSITNGRHLLNPTLCDVAALLAQAQGVDLHDASPYYLDRATKPFHFSAHLGDDLLTSSGTEIRYVQRSDLDAKGSYKNVLVLWTIKFKGAGLKALLKAQLDAMKRLPHHYISAGINARSTPWK